MDLNKPSFAGSYAQRAPMPMPSKPPLPSKPPMPFGAMGNPRGTVEEEPEDEMMPFGMMTGMRGQMQAPSLQRYYDYPSRQPPLPSPMEPMEAPPMQGMSTMPEMSPMQEMSTMPEASPMEPMEAPQEQSAAGIMSISDAAPPVASDVEMIPFDEDSIDMNEPGQELALIDPDSESIADEEGLGSLIETIIGSTSSSPAMDAPKSKKEQKALVRENAAMASLLRKAGAPISSEEDVSKLPPETLSQLNIILDRSPEE